MPRYLHIPHTPDTAQALTLSGRNCLVVSGIVIPPPPKIGSLHVGMPTNDVDVDKEYQLIPLDSL